MTFIELIFVVPLLLIEVYYWFYWINKPENYKTTREYKIEEQCSNLEKKCKSK